MLAISANTASVGVIHVSIAITEVFQEFLDTVDGPEVVLNSTLCTPEIELASVDF